MTRTVLIDGDIVAYRAGFAAEHKKYDLSVDADPSGEFSLGTLIHFDSKSSMNTWTKEHPDVEYSWSSKLEVEPLNFVLSTVKHLIANIVSGCGATEYRVLLSGRENFRHDLATIAKYKGNRDNARRPLHIDEIHKYLIDHHSAIITPNLEADDELANYQLEATEKGEETVIASVDKDLLQIPGKHYNFVKDEKVLVSDDTAFFNLMMQMLTGDSTDNIPGIVKVGPVTAKRSLEPAYGDPKALWAIVKSMWSDYLKGDNCPEYVVSYNAPTGDVVYIDKDGKERTATLDLILKELYTLLKVGGKV